MTPARKIRTVCRLSLRERTLFRGAKDDNLTSRRNIGSRHIAERVAGPTNHGILDPGEMQDSLLTRPQQPQHGNAGYAHLKSKWEEIDNRLIFAQHFGVGIVKRAKS